MLDKARQRPETLYGPEPAQIARGKIQTLAVANEFPSVIQDLIAVGVKTHFIYHVVAKNNAYKQPLPDVLEDRPGQMDAFGIALFERIDREDFTAITGLPLIAVVQMLGTFGVDVP